MRIKPGHHRSEELGWKQKYNIYTHDMPITPRIKLIIYEDDTFIIATFSKRYDCDKETETRNRQHPRMNRQMEISHII